MRKLPIFMACIAILAGLIPTKGSADDDPAPPTDALVEKGKITATINHARQITASCKLWAINHGGKYPEKLADLLVNGYLGENNWAVLQSPLSEGEKYGFYYYGFKFSPYGGRNLVLLSSHWRSADGKRIIAHNDGSAVLETPKATDYPESSGTAGSPSEPSSLSPEAMRSFVIVAGERALGSGFVVRLGGHAYVITNSHVIRGQSKLTFTNMSNQEIQTGPLQIADSADLVRAEITDAGNVLEVETKVESEVKIGDAVAVAGNSEGEGVVREIAGKVVGIGPDRIEVDAPFVSGNSGSPILLKSTGRVIGVATYVKIPQSVRNGEKSATKLNEVRRFGYRLDTVSSWITPPQPSHLLREGEKLNQIAEVESLVRALYLGGPDALMSFGPDTLIGKRQAEIPVLATLRGALQEFCDKYGATAAPDDKRRHVEAVIRAMNAAVGSEVAGLQPGHFSGYFSVLFKQYLGQVKDLQDWFNGGGAVSNWLSGPVVTTTTSKGEARKADAPTSDSDGLITLTAHSLPRAKPDKRYRVTFPSNQMPSDRTNYVWVIDPPSHSVKTWPVDGDTWHLGSTAEKGTYKISIERRFGIEKRAVSNVAEFTVP